MSEESLREIINGAPEFRPAPADGDGQTGPRRRATKPQRDVLVDLVEDNALWRDQDGQAYVTVPINGHYENCLVRSARFRTIIAGGYYRLHGGAPGGQAMEDALRVLEARAINDGPTCRPFRRVGELDGHHYLDLGDDDWRAVEIAPDGWRIVERPPVKFVRSKGMRPLPEPERGGRIEDLQQFINIDGEADFRLVVGWLVGALRATGPYPILLLAGEQGSAKSTSSRICRALIDPNTATSRAAPRDERDLVAAASNSWILSFDNLSGLPVWLADAICRLSTGGGYSARQLHTDMDEALFEGQRPILLNAIPDLGGRADVGDRALSVTLPPIPDSRRRPERTFWADFEEQRPFLLGALLDAVAAALRHLPDVRLERLPRMADFAEWVTAAEPGLGWEPGSFLEAYERNREGIVELAVEASPVAQAVCAFAAKPDPTIEPVQPPDLWRGSSSDLLPLLSGRVSEAVRNSREWPKNASGLGAALRRAAPVLRKRGIELLNSKGGKDSRRSITIRRAMP